MEKKTKKTVWIPVLTFLFLIFGGMVWGLLKPDQAYSDTENRYLAERPAFSWESLFGGSYTRDYESYITDQFPLRDQWVGLKTRTEMLLGKAETKNVWLAQDNYLIVDYPASDFEGEQGGQNRETLANALSYYVNSLGKDHVRVMLVPSASQILTDKLPAYSPVYDQSLYLEEAVKAAEEAFAKAGIEGGAAELFVDVEGALSPHAGEYIYYRTDHHWTAQGAWYAYEAWAGANGLPLFDRSAVPAVTVDGFYGTNYSRARKPGIQPDTITYYDLPNTLSVEDNAGGEVTWETGPMYEYSDFETRDKYRAFLRGNNAYSVLEGNGEGSILVVKDSYANSFIPYLVENYAQIGIVDLRYTVEKVDSFIQRGGYDKVLVLYSFSTFAEDTNFASRAGVAG